MFQEIASVFHNNPILTGGASVAVGAWAWSQVSRHGSSAYRNLLSAFRVSVSVWSDDSSVFSSVDTWLTKQESNKKIRSLLLKRYWDDKANKELLYLTPGPGLHVFRDGWAFYLVNRHIDSGTDKQDSFDAGRRRQTITITTFGRKKSLIERIVKEIDMSDKRMPGVPVYVWRGSSYTYVGRRSDRSLDTIYMDLEKQGSVVSSLDNFLENKERYTDKGIPWRHGVMLSGPPGTGKTSLIFTLASKFKKGLYVIPPSSVSNDESFLTAMNEAGSSFVVVEDIDSIKITEARPKVAGKKAQAPAPEAPQALFEGFGVTLSGLLNGIDGVASREGRVLFITTNTPDVLDPALIRPGRIDHVLEMGPADEEVAKRMFKRFFGDENSEEFFKDISFPIPQAELQEKMIRKYNKESN